MKWNLVYESQIISLSESLFSISLNNYSLISVSGNYPASRKRAGYAFQLAETAEGLSTITSTYIPWQPQLLRINFDFRPYKISFIPIPYLKSWPTIKIYESDELTTDAANLETVLLAIQQLGSVIE